MSPQERAAVWDEVREKVDAKMGALERDDLPGACES